MASKALAKARMRSCSSFPPKCEGCMKHRKWAPEAGQILESGDPGFRDHGCPCSHPRHASLDTVCKTAFTDFHDNTGVLGRERSAGPGKLLWGLKKCCWAKLGTTAHFPKLSCNHITEWHCAFPVYHREALRLQWQAGVINTDSSAQPAGMGSSNQAAWGNLGCQSLSVNRAI